MWRTRSSTGISPRASRAGAGSACARAVRVWAATSTITSTSTNGRRSMRSSSLGQVRRSVQARGSAARELAPDERERVVARRHAPLELRVLERVEDLLEPRPGLEPERDEVLAADERPRL